jgi:hypothetical protein
VTREELEDRFTYHAPTPGGIERHAILSKAMIDAAKSVDLTCSESREKSLAMTKLEEAKFWASAAVARNPSTR